MKCIYWFCVGLWLISAHDSMYSRITLHTTDHHDISETVPYHIDKYTVGTEGRHLYASSVSPDKKMLNEYAFIATGTDNNTVSPLAPRSVINSVNQSVLNPLYNRSCLLMAMLETELYGSLSEHPLIVLSDEPRRVYMMERIVNENTIWQAPSPLLPNAQSVDQGYAVALTGMRDGFVAVAVKPTASDTFGAVGSGIVTLARSLKKDEQHYSLVIVPVHPQDEHELLLATPLDKMHRAFNVGDGNSVHKIHDTVSMVYHKNIDKLFVGVSLEGNDNSQAGLCGLAVGSYNSNYELALVPALPLTALDSEHDAIVASLGGAVAIDQLVSMQTSTGLSYIVVLKNNTVYALPLTSGHSNPLCNGCIASTRCKPEPVFDAVVSFGRGRVMTEMATVPDNTPHATDKAVRVGGDTNIIGTINTVQTIDDLVIVGGSHGLWASRALFNADGVISHWTSWQRYAAVSCPVKGFAFHRLTGMVTIITSGDDGERYNTVERTQWNKVEALMPWLQSNPLDRLFFVSGGYSESDKRWLVGVASDGVLWSEIPHASVHEQSMSGTIKEDTAHNNPDGGAVYIRNEQLKAIAPITAVAYGVDRHDRGVWCFGGINGLVVGRVQSIHDACSADQMVLGSALHEAVFERYDQYQDIKKLIIDDHSVYVLTDTLLYRADLDRDGLLNPTLLASVDMVCGAVGYHMFTDLVVSGKLALLSTTRGLFRSGNAVNVSLASNATMVHWTLVPVHGVSDSPCTHLFVVSSTGKEQDCARLGGSNLYCVVFSNAHRGAYLGRFFVEDVSSKEVSDESIMSFQEPSLKHSFSFFGYLGDHCYCYASDGALHLYGVEPHDSRDGVIFKNLTPYLGSTMFPKTRNVVLPVALHGSGGEPTVMRLPGGSWLVGNDDGMYINE